MTTDWFYKQDGRDIGPMLPAELRRLANEGIVLPDSEVRKGSDGRWVRAIRVAGLFPSTVSGGESPLVGFEHQIADNLAAERLQVPQTLVTPPEPPPLEAIVVPPVPPAAVPLAPADVESLVRCPHCAALLRNDTATAGTVVPCPGCGQHLSLPALALGPVGRRSLPLFNGNWKSILTRPSNIGVGIVLVAIYFALSCAVNIGEYLWELLRYQQDPAPNAPFPREVILALFILGPFLFALYGLNCYGLLKIRAWARPLSQILAGLSILLTFVQFGMFGPGQDLPMQAVDGAICAVVLWFMARREVKAFFMTGQHTSEQPPLSRPLYQSAPEHLEVHKRFVLAVGGLVLLAVVGVILLSFGLWSKPENAIVGKWKQPGETIEFFKDGTVEIVTDKGGKGESVVGKYAFLDKDRINVSLTGYHRMAGTMIWSVAINSGNLVVTFEQGRVARYARVSH